MTKVFLNTFGPFYYERMVASAPGDFTEIVSIGMRLEEGVRTGCLTKETGSSSGTKRVGTGFPKKKEHDVGMVSQGKPRKNVNRGYKFKHGNYPTIPAKSTASTAGSTIQR